MENLPESAGKEERKTVEAAPLLRLRGIRKSFGGHEILRGVSLDVQTGEFLTLLGPSGCGKTTLLRIIGGFETADAGEVFLRESPVGHLPPYERDVHTVFQHYTLFPHYDVFENVAFSLRIRGESEDRIASRVSEMLALVKLEDFEHRMPHQLSGGQQQRVALARALVGRPTLLLLDEPLGALDLKLRKEMQLELKRLQQELRISFVYVTHDQEEALTMSDRIAVLCDGRIEQVGTPRAIYDHPATPFVADFIGTANILSARVQSVVPGWHIELTLEDEVSVGLPWEELPGLREGAQLQVAIRPEQVLVANGKDVPAPGTIVLETTLKDAVYLGSATQLYLSPFVRSSRTITAVTMNPQRKNGFTPGQKILVHIDPQNLRFLTSLKDEKSSKAP